MLLRRTKFFLFFSFFLATTAALVVVVVAVVEDAVYPYLLDTCAHDARQTMTEIGKFSCGAAQLQSSIQRQTSASDTTSV